MNMNGTKAHAVQLPELPSAGPNAQSAQRARSVPPAHDITPPGSSPSPDRVSFLAQAQAFVAGLLTRESLLDARHPSLRATWSGHREAAGRWNGLLLRHGRHAWGVLHLVIMAVLAVAGWITETFIRTAVTVLLIVALIKWS